MSGSDKARQIYHVPNVLMGVSWISINSTKPVFPGDRLNIIGINFDRVWEGTMSDINYDLSRCRNISVDIRYFLFIVDKFAEAHNILNELTIVQ